MSNKKPAQAGLDSLIKKGWTVEAVQRKNGKSKGKWDFYYKTPRGITPTKKLRSKPEVERFLNKRKQYDKNEESSNKSLTRKKKKNTTK